MSFGSERNKDVLCLCSEGYDDGQFCERGVIETFSVLLRLLGMLKVSHSRYRPPSWAPPRGQSAGKILCPLLHHLITLFNQV